MRRNALAYSTAVVLAVGAASATGAANAQGPAAVENDSPPSLRPLPEQLLEPAERGEAIYVERCAQCHGESGMGDGPVGRSLTQLDRPMPDFAAREYNLDTNRDGETGTDADIENILERGALVYGGSMMMGPVPELSETDRDGLIAFIRSLEQ
jgi:mono/diheme cytochrome c family protein